MEIVSGSVKDYIDKEGEKERGAHVYHMFTLIPAHRMRTCAPRLLFDVDVIHISRRPGEFYNFLRAVFCAGAGSVQYIESKVPVSLYFFISSLEYLVRV